MEVGKHYDILHSINCFQLFMTNCVTKYTNY